jgi:hypothetical protein
MHTVSRPAARTAPAGRIERVGYAVVAVGYALMTLGILEIGGLFNLVCGLVMAMTGGVLMFAGEVRLRSDEEAEFKRLIDEL